MRYALIAVAIGASLLCAWVALRLALAEQVAIDQGTRPEGADYTIVIVLAVAAIVLTFAAGGLIAGRAEGAYLLGIGAFMLVIPLGLLVLLTLVAWDTTQSEARNDGLLRLLVWGAFGLDLWVGVQGIRMGRRMTHEREHGDS